MKRRNRKKTIIFLLILFISVGFAYLSASLYLGGTGIFSANTWDIYFDNIVEDTYKTDIVSAASVSNKVTINASINLKQPKSTYTMYADIVNDGSIDAMLDSWNITNDMTNAEADVIDISLSYADGTSLTKYDLLQAGSFDTIVVTAVYKDNINNNQLLTSDGDLNLTITLNYVQADDDAQARSTNPVTITYDYNAPFTFTTQGQYMDTGWIIDWTKDFSVDESVTLKGETSQRHLFIGNYDTASSDALNIEYYTGRKQRVYNGIRYNNNPDHRPSSSLPDEKDLHAIFNWSVSEGKFYLNVITSNNTSNMFSDTLTNTGTDVGDSLLIGTKDRRTSESVFLPIIVNTLKISQTVDVFSEYYLPTPTREGYTFGGWFIKEDFTGIVQNGDKVTRSLTLYAKWVAN